MKYGDKNKCMDCGIELTIKNRHPAYSARLAVIGYRCTSCHEKSKSPETKKREEEISRLTKDIPRPENIRHDLLRSLKENQ
ncbi:MAG: hypothetical protein OIN88_12940 [Candidatus Methanoperedens sp.]|nr:hypothetical protein [Candidatus Methanoperedens sp.]MCZ7360260.1 hypothetical protein [Candidatus Methanoperedens sp.]HLB71004.1 hypothetical protein [Candidatus Methanoperedens sp.]